MPVVISPAVMSFPKPNFNFLSVTLVQNIATKTTGRILQDYIMVTTGKLVYWMAIIEKRGAEAAVNPVIAAFLIGITTLSGIINSI